MSDRSHLVVTLKHRQIVFIGDCAIAICKYNGNQVKLHISGPRTTRVSRTPHIFSDNPQFDTLKEIPIEHTTKYTHEESSDEVE